MIRPSIAIGIRGATFPAFAVLAVSLALSTPARAQEVNAAPVPGADDITTLEKNLASEHAALSTVDCATACRALASIRRAADRICALDPDERCVAARAKADDATRRVRDACPTCTIASVPPQPTPPMARPAKKGADDSESAHVAASAPPSESKRGGCAGCTTSATSRPDLGSGALALAALVFAMRRRSKRS